MSGRTSGALFALIAHGSARAADAPPFADADAKRQLLDNALADGGPAAVVALGRRVRGAGFVPLVHALTATPEPEELAARYMRLERYFHTRNRTRISVAPGTLTARRHTVSDDVPSRGENLLILGLLAGLLERIGCSGVAWSFDGAHAQELLLVWKTRPAAPSSAASADTPKSDAESLLSNDPAHHWTLRAVAERLGRAPRSLQRDLARQGTTLSLLLRRVRVRRACTMLTDTTTSLAEVGFCCGFADQAHFTRGFKAATGLTPGTYRGSATMFRATAGCPRPGS